MNLDTQPNGKPRTFLAHDLWTDADINIPDVICDRNGKVTLSLCKVCGQAEADLDYDCPGSKQSD